MKDKKIERNQLLIYCANQRWLGAIKEEFSGLISDIFAKKVCTTGIATLKRLLDNDSPYVAAIIVVPSLKVLTEMGMGSAEREQIAMRKMAPFHIWVIDIGKLKRVRYQQKISIMTLCTYWIDMEFSKAFWDIFLLDENRFDTSYGVFRLFRQYYQPKNK